jgi:hypothetical protein
LAESNARLAKIRARKADRGTKVTVEGIPGVVFWRGDDQYRRGGVRVGVKFEDGTKKFFPSTKITVG